MHWRIAAIAALGGVIIIFIAIIAAFCVVGLSQVKPSSKEIVAQSIAGGTLSLGALALAFLGYSLAQRQDKWGTKVAKVHSRVAFTMFLLIVFSVLDAMTSIGYLLISSSSLQDTFSWMFGTSLVLVFVIGGTLVAATTYVVAEEVAR
jgi:hypothetical protein